ncbi:MAG: sugar nucleotide-binding protein [Limimaricola sp.]|uniref:sugar nucleotide-binding protein n=1 Tax=Limimaricola sp. TaxID=2211665 RepID=UPI001E0A05E5|nr:sugar nucleotide-binding protein [Limimaricola sp.]MBI1418768.1 sugar nucleotide-binding protein [Limimaricola sp.]
MTKTVLILGASGKIGSFAAEAFWNAGWTVRRYDRSTDMTAAAKGADVIVNGLNPPAYHDWAHIIPAITAQVIAAAKASGATVIVPGNVYNFAFRPGRTTQTWDETTPQAPTTRKGRVRKEMEEAYAASGVRTIILRAGSFIAPGREDDTMGAILLRDLAKGKVTVPGRPDTRHAYTYLPDWARAAVMLAERRESLSRFEDIPMPGPHFTPVELKSALEAELGRKLRFGGFPWALMRLASPFWELAREMSEMKPLWFTSHRLGGAKFARLLPEFQPTPVANVMLSGLASQVHPDKAVRSGGQPVTAQ